MITHFDYPLSSLTKQILTTLSPYDLVQIIMDPLMSTVISFSGSLFNLITTLIKKSTATDTHKSEHYCIRFYFRLSVSTPTTYRTVIYIMNIGRPSFVTELSSISIFLFVETANKFYALP